MPDYDQMVRRQGVLADFGEFTLCCDDLDQILTEACRLVAEALGTKRAKILEIQDHGRTLFVRAGVGWAPGVVGQLRLSIDDASSETYSIQAGKPVITRDIRQEDRFDVPEFMRQAGVVSLVNTPIRLPGGKAYGLLQVDDTEPHDFGEEDTKFLQTYTTILGPVLDRLLKLGDLRSTRERFRITAEEILDYAIFATDPDGRITDWLPGAEAVFGWPAAEAVGQPAAMMFTPEDREKGEPEKEMAQAREAGLGPDVRWHVCKNGSRVFIEGSVRPLRNDEGRLTGFLKIGQDVTERRADEVRLRESEGWLRTLIEGVPQLLWRSEPRGQWIWSSPQWQAYTGQSQEESIGLGWLDALHPEDRDAAMEAWDDAAGRGRLDVEYRVRRASDGAWRWHQTRSLPVQHPPRPEQERGGTEWLGTSTDIEELKGLQNEQSVLVAELQHRTRNLLGVMQNVARKSIPPSPGRDVYDARLAAVSRVQGFLGRSTAYTAPLRELVEAELQAAGDGTSPRVLTEGPAVELPGQGVQPLALALHELATNAVKYGALAEANPAGRLSVRWHLAEGRYGQELVLTWQETGVAMPAEPPSRRGYGSELITRALPYQLKAETRLEFRPDGVWCEVKLPAGSFTCTKDLAA